VCADIYIYIYIYIYIFIYIYVCVCVFMVVARESVFYSGYFPGFSFYVVIFPAAFVLYF